MAAAASQPKLLVIVGPTASGKSDLAIRVAKEFNGEIICADSRTVYKGMDIGTAKPSNANQRAIRHWGLDLVEPGQLYSAAQFKAYAQEKILDIQSRNKLPVLVGGTGLYIDSVLFDFSFVISKKLAFRQRFIYTWWSIEKLQKVIQQRDWPMPENRQNRRHLINTFQRQGRVGGKADKPRADALIIGLLPSDEELRKRIDERAEEIFKREVVNETLALKKKFGKRALTKNGGIVYGICLRLLDIQINEAEAIELFKIADWQYARRQRTWFRRNRYIKWFSSSEQAYKAVRKQLLNT